MNCVDNAKFLPQGWPQQLAFKARDKQRWFILVLSLVVSHPSTDLVYFLSWDKYHATAFPPNIVLDKVSQPKVIYLPLVWPRVLSVATLQESNKSAITSLILWVLTQKFLLSMIFISFFLLCLWPFMRTKWTFSMTLSIFFLCSYFLICVLQRLGGERQWNIFLKNPSGIVLNYALLNTGFIN